MTSWSHRPAGAGSGAGGCGPAAVGPGRSVSWGPAGIAVLRRRPSLLRRLRSPGRSPPESSPPPVSITPCGRRQGDAREPEASSPKSCSISDAIGGGRAIRRLAPGHLHRLTPGGAGRGLHPQQRAPWLRHRGCLRGGQVPDRTTGPDSRRHPGVPHPGCHSTRHLDAATWNALAGLVAPMRFAELADALGADTATRTVATFDRLGLVSIVSPHAPGEVPEESVAEVQPSTRSPHERPPMAAQSRPARSTMPAETPSPTTPPTTTTRNTCRSGSVARPTPPSPACVPIAPSRRPRRRHTP
jgi:hypothetical protein